MTTRVNTKKTWYAGIILLIGLGLIFVSCSNDNGGNPIVPQGETQSDFIASQGNADAWGAYYTEGNSTFYSNVPEAGAYQLEYAIQGGGPFYITFDTPEPAILEVGLLPGHILRYACVTSGTITVPEETANVGIKSSWKVTVYSVTDDDGDNVSWWNPGSDAQTLFTADPNSQGVCVIEDGQLGDGIVEIDPPDRGNGTNPPGGGGPTPPFCTVGTQLGAYPGECWIQGGVGVDCNAVCGAAGCDAAATASMLGDNAKCQNVSTAIGAAGGGAWVGAGGMNAYGCYEYDAGGGGDGIYNETVTAPTCGAFEADSRRYCACTP